MDNQLKKDMKRGAVLLLFLYAFVLPKAQEEKEDLLINNFWRYNGAMANGDWSNALYQHISTYAFSQINERSTFVGNLKTKSEWESRQADLKKIFAEIVGDFPEKTPLNPRITGTVKKEGFVVEKLYFESRPGYYVTAALFLPTAKKGKLPAIVYCCGHSVNGFKGYQKPILNLVKKGFIVLAFDPIGQGERIQYFDANGKTVFHPDHEHSYPGTQSFVSGRTPSNYFIWDGIRAVDYLISRKEVDPARIGITGRSGGGTQTAMIMAVDDRILAAAPECYISTYDKIFRTEAPQDAEQNLMYALKKGMDMGDFIEVRAPKPTLLVTTTHDFFSIQGARDTYNEAKKAYTAWGFPENLSMVEDDAGHASTPKNMMALHAFFQKHLNNPGDPKIEDIELLTEKELTVTPTGQAITSLQTETLFTLNKQYAEELSEKLQSKRQDTPDFYKQIAQEAKSLSGYSEPELSKEFIFSGRLWRDACAIEKYLVKSAGSYHLPVLRFLTENNNGHCILLLDDQGKASAAAKGGLAEQLAKKGYQVIVPDLSGFGELGGGFNYGDAIIKDVPLNVWYAGILTHKSPLAIRVEEIKIIVDFIKTLDAPHSITGIGCGVLASDLLHAVVINKEFNQIALINPLYSYRSIVQEKEYHPKYVMSTPAGVIANYDMPDLVTAISPLKICMLNPVNSLDQPIDNPIFDQTYRDAKQKYGQSSNWTVSCNERDVFSRLAQWIGQ